MRGSWNPVQQAIAASRTIGTSVRVPVAAIPAKNLGPPAGDDQGGGVGLDGGAVPLPGRLSHQISRRYERS